MSRSIFSALGAALLLVAMGWHDPESIYMFIDIPSLIIVLGCTTLFTCAHHSATHVLTALVAALSSRSLTPHESLHHQRVLSTARLLAASSGVVGTMIGLVQMLANMDNPSKIGPAMAVALLCTFYGIVLAEICLAPLVHRLRSQTLTKEGAPAPAEEMMHVSVITITSLPLVIFCFFVLLNSLCG